MLTNLNQGFNKTKIHCSLGSELLCYLGGNEVLELGVVKKFVVSGKSEYQWHYVEIG
jgi:hypothetical protein